MRVKVTAQVCQKHSASVELNTVASVMYIAAVPSTEQNLAYIARQRDAFVQGKTPPDYGKDGSESWVKGVATEADIVGPVSRRAMGFPV